MKLTPAIVAEICQKSLQDVENFEATTMQINHIDDISMCISLKKLNLTDNSLESKESLSGIHYNKGLTMLNLSKNLLNNVEYLRNLKKLVVLNISHNKLVDIPLFLSSFSELKALVLNNNQIGFFAPELKLPKQLTALILSHNLIEDISYFSTRKLPELTKLSLSHNSIRILPHLQDSLPCLKELRLSDNKISKIELHSLPSTLEILELNNNLINTFGDIEALKKLPYLTHLSLKGCQICKTEESYCEKIKEMLPSLRILDGRRFDERFLKRKEKYDNRKSKLLKSSEKNQDK